MSLHQLLLTLCTNVYQFLAQNCWIIVFCLILSPPLLFKQATYNLGFHRWAWSYKQPSRLAVLAPGYLAGSFIFRVIKEYAILFWWFPKKNPILPWRKMSQVACLWRSDLLWYDEISFILFVTGYGLIDIINYQWSRKVV